MEFSAADLQNALLEFNPWWSGQSVPWLPKLQRRAAYEAIRWLKDPTVPRGLLLAGARQVGKTTVLLQAVDRLLRDRVPPKRILYATFDSPVIRSVGLDGLMKAWREVNEESTNPEYLLLDELQHAENWQVWVKHQVDFKKNRRILFTGSAMPLVTQGQESGVGRWSALRISTLSFYEFLQIRSVPPTSLLGVSSLRDLYKWKPAQFTEVSFAARAILPQFNEYLVRGGFPQCALARTARDAQRFLREDVVDRVINRDMTALYNVRRVLDLEKLFLYLCLNGGGIIDLQTLACNMQNTKPTVENFLKLLEATHMIYLLPPFGYGKEVLRGRQKAYLADSAIGPAVMSKGERLLEDGPALGIAVETTIFKHIFTRFYSQTLKFSYWRGSKDREVDLIVEAPGRTIPFEVKYRGDSVGAGELKGLTEFCTERKLKEAYVITRDIDDFGILPLGPGLKALKIPAALACHWLGEHELASTDA